MTSPLPQQQAPHPPTVEPLPPLASTDPRRAVYEALMPHNQAVEESCQSLAAKHDKLAEFHKHRVDDIESITEYRSLADDYGKLNDQYAILHQDYQSLARTAQDNLSIFAHPTNPTALFRQAKMRLADISAMSNSALDSADKYREKADRLVQKNRAPSERSHDNWETDHRKAAQELRSNAETHRQWRGHAFGELNPQALADAREQAKAAMAQAKTAAKPAGAQAEAARVGGRGGQRQRVNPELVRDGLRQLSSSNSRQQANTKQLISFNNQLSQSANSEATRSAADAVRGVIKSQQNISQDMNKMISQTGKYVDTAQAVDKMRFN